MPLYFPASPRWKNGITSHMRPLLPLLFAIAFTIPSFPQEFHFGVKGGVPLTASFETERVTSRIRPYTVGAAAELRFQNHFGVEVDVLYKRVGYAATAHCGLRCQPLVISLNPSIARVHRSDTVEVKGNSWEIPVLVRYTLPWTMRPFLSGGITARHLRLASLRCIDTDFSFGSGVPGGGITESREVPCGATLPSRNFAGLVVSAGIEIGNSRLRVVPEFRYVHWFQNGPWDQAIARVDVRPRFRSNQADFLLGLMF